jgi:hypothetical protein
MCVDNAETRTSAGDCGPSFKNTPPSIATIKGASAQAVLRCHPVAPAGVGAPGAWGKLNTSKLDLGRVSESESPGHALRPNSVTRGHVGWAPSDIESGARTSVKVSCPAMARTPGTGLLFSVGGGLRARELTGSRSGTPHAAHAQIGAVQVGFSFKPSGLQALNFNATASHCLTAIQKLKFDTLSGAA